MAGDHIIHRGDCLGDGGLIHVMPKSLDVFITDPPYSEHVHTKSERGLTAHAGEISRRRDFGFNHLDEMTLQRSAAFMALAARRWVLVFCDVESSQLWAKALVAGGLEYVRTGAWVKVGGAPQFTGDRPAVGFEAIVICHQRGRGIRKRWNGGGRPAVWQHPIVVERGDGTERLHTAQKPEALMEELVKLFSDPGETICDPFAGSGTTGVAAKKWGRKFIGWDKDAGISQAEADEKHPAREPYAVIGQRRIDAAKSVVDDVDELRRLTARPRKLKQLEMAGVDATASGRSTAG